MDLPGTTSKNKEGNTFMPRGWFSCCKQLTTEFRVNCPECGSTEHFRELPDKPEYETTGHYREIVEIEGFAYEHVARRQYERPVIVHVFYPTGVRTRQSGYIFPRKVISCIPDYSTSLDEHSVRWALINGAKTRSDLRWTYEEPIPCPQPRAKEKEYSHGLWRKYTRTKGWEVI